MRSAFQRHWFLLALALVLIVGIWGTHLLQPLATSSLLQQSVVFSTMLVMALPLRIEQLRAGVARPKAAILAIASNLLLVPGLAFCIAPFLPPPLAIGLLVTATVPCTLASAAVLARRGGGDPTVPILTTLFTNGICFLYTPFALSILLPQSGQTGLDFWSTASQLLFLILSPMVIAQGLRAILPVKRWADRSASRLGILSQIGILIMVGISAIQMGQRWQTEGGSSELAPLPLIKVFCAVIAVHLIAYAVTWWSARKLGISYEQTLGAALAGSQKTLMVGLQIAVSPNLDASILPMIAYHVSQLLIDTFLTNRSSPGSRT